MRDGVMADAEGDGLQRMMAVVFPGAQFTTTYSTSSVMKFACIYGKRHLELDVLLAHSSTTATQTSTVVLQYSILRISVLKYQ